MRGSKAAKRRFKIFGAIIELPPANVVSDSGSPSGGDRRFNGFPAPEQCGDHFGPVPRASSAGNLREAEACFRKSVVVKSREKIASDRKVPVNRGYGNLLRIALEFAPQLRTLVCLPDGEEISDLQKASEVQQLLEEKMENWQTIVDAVNLRAGPVL